MAGVSSPTQTSGREQSQDFELNITALIDCFTVLIAFMLTAATFVSIGILDAGVSAAGATAIKAEPSKYLLTIEMNSDHSIGMKVSGQASYSKTISSDAGKWNYNLFAKELADIRSKWPELNAATLMSDNKVEYQDVIKAMELAKTKGTNVLLGGF